MTLAGAGLEMSGFATVAWELGRVQREEFGAPEFVLRAREAARWTWSRLRGKRSGVAIRIGAADGIRVASHATASSRHGSRPQHVDDRVTLLERQHDQLREALDEVRVTMRTEVESARARADEAEAKLQGVIGQTEQRRRRALRKTLSVQAIGTLMFIFGAVFSVLGSTLSC